MVTVSFMSHQDPRISYALGRLQQRLYAGITDAVAPQGLTTLQYTTLSVLSRHGAPLSTSQLARRSFMAPQSMSEVIHALEDKGFIKRNPDPKRRRVLPATLTARGRRALAKCDEVVGELEDRMLDGLTDEERATFLEMMKAAVRNLGAGFPPHGATDGSRAAPVDGRPAS